MMENPRKLHISWNFLVRTLFKMIKKFNYHFKIKLVTSNMKINLLYLFVYAIKVAQSRYISYEIMIFRINDNCSINTIISSYLIVIIYTISYLYIS